MALSTSLLSAYKFDANSNDSVGSNNGIDTDISYVTGKLNNCASFNGSSSNISLASTLATGSSAFSISGWIYINSTASRYEIYGWGAASSGQGFTFNVNASQKLSSDFYGATSVTGNTTISTGKWYHVAVTFDGSIQRLYVNGVLDGTSGSYTPSLASGNSVFGKTFWASAYYFDGKMDEFLLHQKTLSADEVSQLCNSGRANAYPLTDTPSLYGGVAYYKLDESSGNASDEISYKTLTNTSGTYSAGKVNNGWNGSGSTTYLRNTSFSIGSQANFTVAFWFKTSSSSRGDLMDFNKADRTSSIQILANSYSAGDSAGRVGVNLYYSGATHWTDASTTGLNNGSWHHLAFTVSGANTTIYIDGASAGTNTNGTAMFLDDLAVMGDPANSANYLNGSMDELFVCNRALSSTEISSLYNSGSGNQYPFSVNITVNPSALSAVFSSQATTVSGQAIINSSIINGVLSTQSPSIITAVAVSPAVRSAVFSIPTINVITPDSMVTPSVLSSVFSTQAPYINIFYPDVTVTPSVQNLTFSIQTPTTVASQYVNIQASVFSAVLSTNEVTIYAEKSVSVDVGTLNLYFSIITPKKVGGLWSQVERETGDWTPEARII